MNVMKNDYKAEADQSAGDAEREVKVTMAGSSWTLSIIVSNSNNQFQIISSHRSSLCDDVLLYVETAR